MDMRDIYWLEGMGTIDWIQKELGRVRREIHNNINSIEQRLDNMNNVPRRTMDDFNRIDVSHLKRCAMCNVPEFNKLYEGNRNPPFVPNEQGALVCSNCADMLVCSRCNLPFPKLYGEHRYTGEGCKGEKNEP
jgi:hypothetical protein